MTFPPVIYIHWGNSDYLKYAINQTKYYNPDTSIYLLGDSKNAHLKNVIHHSIKDYSEHAEAFEKVYIHYNTIPLYYTLFWFKRWFVMNDFFNQIGYTGPFICFDSDTMMYFNITHEFLKFKDYDLTINGERSPHCIFFKKVSVLNEFCDFIMQFYSQKKGQDELRQMDTDYKKKNEFGGIDDMTLLNLFSQINPTKTGNSAEIINKEVYDGNINFSQGFEFDSKRKRKKIYWFKNLPYGKNIADNKYIKFNVLHFQGGAKYHMHKFYIGKGLFFAKMWTPINYFIERVKTLILKIL